MPHQSSAPLHRRDGSLAHHRQTIIASAIWLALAGAFLGYSLSSGASPTETLQAAIDLLRTPFGPLIYILIYTLRPLAFFSAVIVTLIGGAIWGPLWGTLFAIIGSNMSATLAYWFGRAFGSGVLPEGKDGVLEGMVGHYTRRLQANAFSAILMMRLIYLPYDLVNYLAGFLRVPYRPYLLGSVIGALPGTLTFTLAGASLALDDILAGRFSVSVVNPWTLACSAGLFIAGIVIARMLRRKEQQLTTLVVSTDSPHTSPPTEDSRGVVERIP
jgi:uncharacterized membrane protein YdjX (TVP38/TMEM64 family)